MAEEAEKDLSQDGGKEPWQLKEALVVIPFLASALALTWEVGFFVRIKGAAFGLFTISEHITFSLQALPIAIVMAGMAVSTIFQVDLTIRFIRPSIDGKVVRNPRRAKLLAIFGALLLIAGNTYVFLYSPAVVVLTLDFIGAVGMLLIVRRK